MSAGAAMVGGGRRTVLQRAALEFGVLFGCLAVLGPVAWSRSGPGGLAVAGLAVGVCGLGAIAGRLVGRMFASPELIVANVLGGMLPRMGIPLVACMIVHATLREPLVEAGFVYYLLPTYLAMLAVETWLALPRKASERAGTGKSR